MKQLNSDFSNAKVGDPVYTLIPMHFGVKGIITSISDRDLHPIRCSFNNQEWTFNRKGMYRDDDELASIFTHPVKLIHADDMPVNPRIAEIESEIQRLQNELKTLKEASK